MYDRFAYISLVTPAEAVKLTGYRTIKDSKIAVEVAEEYGRTGDLKESFAGLLGAVWNAGRIQGIREERARRSSRSATNRG